MKPFTLLPEIEGGHVDFLSTVGDTILIHMTAAAPSVCCPLCKKDASRIHSHCESDSPINPGDIARAHSARGSQVLLRQSRLQAPYLHRADLRSRRPLCPKDQKRPVANLSHRILPGGRAGAMEADDWEEVSRDTLIRRVRQVTDALKATASVCARIGCRRSAFRKGQRYGPSLLIWSDISPSKYCRTERPTP